jgi:hypothetical protein
LRYLVFAFILCSAASSQTPFEFGVVRALVEGDPFVSVMRIELDSGSPAPGCNTLELSARAGLDLDGTGLSLFVDTVDASGITFSGQSLFDISLLSGPFDRILQVIQDKNREFPSTRVTHVRLDLVAYDDLSWISLEFPLTLADSLQSGIIDREQFWSLAGVTMLEIGTASTPLLYRPPLSFDLPETRQEEVVITRSTGNGSQAWKSLLLPGWGQLASGEGVGWVNLLVEAGAVGLYVSGYEEEGFAVLGTNHLVSFFDLL